MGLNIKNPEVERSANEVASLAKETKTEAIRRALIERKRRLQAGTGPSRRLRLERFLREKIWLAIPPHLLGVGTTKKEREEILGYGPEGF